jgi:hypothetical protein
MNNWKKYKEQLRQANPLHLFDPTKMTTDDVARSRYQICLGCPELTATTKQCKQCGCFMNAKTKLRDAQCPLGKW